MVMTMLRTNCSVANAELEIIMILNMIGMIFMIIDDHDHDHGYDGDDDGDNDDDDIGPAHVVEAVNEDRRQRSRVEAFEQLEEKSYLADSEDECDNDHKE